MTRIITLFAICLALIPATVRAQGSGTLVAVPDLFVVVHDQTFSSGEVSLIENDLAPPGEALVAVITRGPESGVITLLPDGTFTYTPNEGFLGEDSFEYRIESIPIQDLVFDPARSSLELDATVETQIGIDSDRESIQVIGTAQLDIGTGNGAIERVHLLDLDLRNQGTVGLRVDYGSLVTVLTIRLDIPAEGIQLMLNDIGPAAQATGPLGSFTQTGNKIGVDANIYLRGEGVLGGLVPSGPQHLLTETDFDAGGFVFVISDELNLILNVDMDNAFDIEGNAIDLRITGTVHATGPLLQGEVSDPTTVVINVISPVAVASEEAPRVFKLHPVYPNPVALSATITYELDQVSEVDVKVFDILGREVDQFPVELRRPGSHRLIWDTTGVPAGLYIVRMTAGGRSQSRAFVVRR